MPRLPSSPPSLASRARGRRRAPTRKRLSSRTSAMRDLAARATARSRTASNRPPIRPSAASVGTRAMPVARLSGRAGASSRTRAVFQRREARALAASCEGSCPAVIRTATMRQRRAADRVPVTCPAADGAPAGESLLRPTRSSRNRRRPLRPTFPNSLVRLRRLLCSRTAAAVRALPQVGFSGDRPTRTPRASSLPSLRCRHPDRFTTSRVSRRRLTRARTPRRRT